jgi:aminobenzoyl-glutamate utilization protein B
MAQIIKLESANSHKVFQTTSQKKAVLAWITNNESQLIKICDKIWELAELGLIEARSSELLANEFEQNGFRVERGIANMPTAFEATWGESHPVIGIMGEYDALPGLSQKKLPWKEPLETNKPGHGCGHNIHGTSGMAAAIAVKNAIEKHNIKGTVKFFGTPAEENFSGKVFMVRDSCFSQVDAVISHHPDDMNSVDLRSSLAINSVKFHFYGKASHAGGSPEQGRSALDAVELMNTGVNYLREHVIQDARIHYIIEKGGNQPNIVPAYARSWYYIRAPEREELQFIYDWILDIARGASTMSRTEMKTEFLEGTYNVIPNRTIAELIVENMNEIGVPKYSNEEMKFAGDIARTFSRESKTAQLKKSKRPNWERLVDKLIDDEIPSPWGEGDTTHGSTDVGDVSWQVPTVEFGTATWVLGTPAHSWQAVAQSGVGLGHKSLLFASKVMGTTVIDLLTIKEYLKKAKEEHKRRVRNKEYQSPIPPEHNPPLDTWKK